MTQIIRTAIASAVLAFAMLASPSANAGALPGFAEGPSASAVAVELDGTLNLNEASAAELELLPGIGPSIAQRIVDYRTERPFKQLNHLMRVKGVGKKTYLKVKPYITVEGDTNLRVAG